MTAPDAIQKERRREEDKECGGYDGREGAEIMIFIAVIFLNEVIWNLSLRECIPRRNGTCERESHWFSLQVDFGGDMLVA